MSEEDCIFCRIVRGELPAWKVYEDEHVLGLLDINPLSRGHVLVVPKKHIIWFHEMDAELTAQVFTAANIISNKIKKAYDTKYIDLFARGTRIPHVHIFLIPTHKGETNPFDQFVNMISYVQENLKKPYSDEQMDEIAKKIRDA